ncbi:LLM class flavin-dependent oxidoreductase [Streptomyces avermitilis]|nr:LLM class flavin-dependent oxidoreductase [Streptomyces sp. SID5469]
MMRPTGERRELARQAVDLGYDALLVSDHVDQRLAPVPTVAAAAEVADDLVVGTYVLNNDPRHPLMPARPASWWASRPRSRDILRARRERWGFDCVTVPAAAAGPFAPVVAGLKGQ